MTPEAQRIAIAEACGWKFCQARASIKDSVWISGINPNPDVVVSRFDAATGAPKELSKTNGFETLPNYLNDLNAMARAEETLNHDQWESYEPLLADIVFASRDFTQPWVGSISHATAIERAEAFLRTLNLWKEDAP